MGEFLIMFGASAALIFSVIITCYLLPGKNKDD